VDGGKGKQGFARTRTVTRVKQVASASVRDRKNGEKEGNHKIPEGKVSDYGEIFKQRVVMRVGEKREHGLERTSSRCSEDCRGWV